MQRGRKSTASLAIAGPVGVSARQAPPRGMPDAQRAVWLAVVNSRPADWFGYEHVPLLTQLCRHKVVADALAGEIAAFDPEWMKDSEGLRRLDALTKIHARETAHIHSLARGMRLTQQSTYDAKRARTGELAGKGHKPWQRSLPPADES